MKTAGELGEYDRLLQSAREAEQAHDETKGQIEELDRQIAALEEQRAVLHVRLVTEHGARTAARSELRCFRYWHERGSD